MSKWLERMRKGNHSPQAAPAAAFSANAFQVGQGSQWWPPQLGGPTSLLRASISSCAVGECRSILNSLSTDTYLEYVKAFYDAGIALWGANWEYHDINTVLLTASRIIKPRRYMEIGVRRGRSAAMVLTQQSDCEFVGFDLWIPDYASMDNPGPDFVHQELSRLGHTGRREFVSGDSRATVPAYFSTNPDCYFDIITVDGDHTAEGARADIRNCMPRLRVGGLLVFDDTSNSSHPELNAVWNECMAEAPNFSSIVFNEVGFGVGICARKY